MQGGSRSAPPGTLAQCIALPSHRYSLQSGLLSFTYVEDFRNRFGIYEPISSQSECLIFSLSDFPAGSAGRGDFTVQHCGAARACALFYRGT